MKKVIDYEALSARLHKAVKIAKKLGLQVIPGGGYSMDASFRKVPDYPVGLFGALSIVEGQGARGKLGLTYPQTAALEAGFNSIEYPGRKAKRPIQSKRIKKDEEYLKLEALGKELAKKLIPITLKSYALPKKKRAPDAYNRFISRPVASPWNEAPVQVAVNAPPVRNDLPAAPEPANALFEVRAEAMRGLDRWQSSPRYVSGPVLEELQISFDPNDDIDD